MGRRGRAGERRAGLEEREGGRGMGGGREVLWLNLGVLFDYS